MPAMLLRDLAEGHRAQGALLHGLRLRWPHDSRQAPGMPDSTRSLHVVAAAITDPRGRILLARRTDGRDLAGLWEFPGGKREPDESPEEALVRELHEELGITAKVGPPLIDVPQQYPGKRLRLDVRHVVSWQGTPRGIEGQALAWVAPGKLCRYPMPPADRPVVAALLQPDRYLVTPEPGVDDAAWLAGLARALKPGVIGRVQLRAPNLQAQPRWRQLVLAAVALCRKTKTEVLINSDIGLARELGVGVHLRAAQLPALSARPLPADTAVAASCHNTDELRMAEALGCDFAVVGSVLATATHAGGKALGWEGFARLRESVSLPIYAIGGLTPAHFDQARQHGAQGIAAIRGLWP